MSFPQYDVVVVGAGCAGLTAAIGLARAGFTVAVVESAPQPGANGIGGVCFAGNLAQPDILGPDGVEALAWERRLIERGSFATDGRRLVGNTYRDFDAFHHCYTVLRHRFDRCLAEIARTNGALVLTGTTAGSLIRDGQRILGIATSRGPLYGDLVFLAEGDAGHLVSHEGLDRSSDPRHAPAFLYCLEQIIDLPSGAIEKYFRVGPEEGVAYDLLLRNREREPLNARGFVCTGQQSVIVSVVVPVEHLRQHFEGEPRQLLDWFADMPALQPWWRDGRRGAWTARLIRAGGTRDIPYLVEDGLAVGGAAAGLSVDFPVLNSTGPATATALFLSRAATCIRVEGGGFTREQLLHHYVQPLQQSRHWKDVEFLQRWPGYVKKTRVLFDQSLDLLLDSAEVWTRPRRWLPRKLLGWFSVLSRVRWTQWGELQKDLFQIGWALRLREVTPRLAPARAVLDGALNAFRDLARRPRPHLPPGGTLGIHYYSADEDGTASATPSLLRRWFGRFRPVLASASHILYRNDDAPLSMKLTNMAELLMRQINLLDMLAAAVLSFLTVLASTMLAVGGYLFRRTPPQRMESARGTAMADAPCRGDEDRPTPQIHVVWKSAQPRQRADAVRGLRHICPTGVFEVHGEPSRTVEVVVHSEKCIQCEACWRTNPVVDWGRGVAEGEDNGAFVHSVGVPRVDLGDLSDRLSRVLDQIEHKLIEFETALAKGSATVDRWRSDYLEMLARYAQQLAIQVQELLQESAWPADAATVRQQLLELAAALVAKTEERTRRTWDGRFAWAAADGRQLRQYHLIGLRRLLGEDVFYQPGAPATGCLDPSLALRAGWVPSVAHRAEDAAGKHWLADIAVKLYLVETLDRVLAGTPMRARAELLTAVADEVREGLASQSNKWSIFFDGAVEFHATGRRPVGEVYRRQGPRLLADAAHTRKLLDVAGDWSTLTQRHALLAEREEIQKAEGRLTELARNWRGDSCEQTAETGVGSAFARQVAHVLACKKLLLRTHTRLEDGLDAELAVVLLRVWLDYVATELDEFAVVVQDRLHPPLSNDDRPLVEPGSGAPLRTRAEYLAAPAPYASGDFLLVPVDLLQPRLVPEMVAVAGVPLPREEEAVYLAETLETEIIGRRVHLHTRSIELESASARLIVAELQRRRAALPERCVILQALAEEVMPRLLRSGVKTAVRHIGRDALELEALKADFRQRLTAAWQVFGEALGRNPDVQASCFALAEAAAWLKAADSTLGRMAWLSRLSQAEDRDEPAAQELGRRVLAHCHAQTRDRLRRFDEDLAALRRGYYAPHVHAAALLLAKESNEIATDEHG